MEEITKAKIIGVLGAILLFLPSITILFLGFRKDLSIVLGFLGAIWVNISLLKFVNIQEEVFNQKIEDLESKMEE